MPIDSTKSSRPKPETARNVVENILRRFVEIEVKLPA